MAMELDLLRGSLISLSSDNRIHLYDIESGKEKRTYVEKNNLSYTYCCHAWSNFAKVNDKVSLGYYAVGTTSGSVFVWDLDRGVVKFTLALDSAPNDVKFSDGHIVVSTSTSSIVKYDLASGKQISSTKIGKKPATSIAINPKVNNIVSVANSSLYIINLDTDQKRKFDLTVPGGIQSTVFSNCGRYLACCGSGSREIFVFDVQADSSSAPVSVIAVDNAPITLGIRSFSSKDSITLNIFCSMENQKGSIAVLNIPKKSSNNEASISSRLIRIDDSVAVLAGAFGTIAKEITSTKVTLAFTPSSAAPSQSSSSKILFKEFSLVGEDGDYVNTLNYQSKTSSTSTTKASKETMEASQVMGPFEAGAQKRALLEENMSNETSHKRMKSDQENEGPEGDVQISVAVDDRQEAQTLEQKLKALSSQLTKQQLKQRGQSLFSQELTPTSDSLVTLIEQALQSGDNALLEQCLMCEDGFVIEETSKRLPATRVLVLMKRLVSKFEKSPSRGLLLTKWLAALLRHHTAFLISMPSLAQEVAGLSEMLQQRLSTYARLSALSGRMDLLMSQIGLDSSNHGSSSQKQSVSNRNNHSQSNSNHHSLQNNSGNNRSSSSEEAAMMKPKKVYIEE